MKARALLLFVLAVPGLSSQDLDKDAQPRTEHVSADTGLASPAPVDYVIGPSDVLTVTVWKQANLSSSLLVRPDGMISMPLLGDVTACGLRPAELAEVVTQKLKRYIQDPNVSVVVTQINSRKVYLLGEIARRGPVDLTSGMRLIEAISSAGGLTDYANARKIYILRREGGSPQRIPVRYKEALKGKSDLNVLLKPGDTIVIP